MKTFLRSIATTLLFSLLFSSGLWAQTATPLAQGNGASGDSCQITTLENLYRAALETNRNIHGDGNMFYQLRKAVSSNQSGAKPEPNPINGLRRNGSFAGGEGSTDDLYKIETWEHLNNVRDFLDAHFILMNDLDENSPGYDEYASKNANGGKGWIPIGGFGESKDEIEPFTGTLDGNNKTISHLNVGNAVKKDALFQHKAQSPIAKGDQNDGVFEFGGLFGAVENPGSKAHTAIKNLTINDSFIAGFAAGSIAAYAINVDFEKVAATNTTVFGLISRNA